MCINYQSLKPLIAPPTAQFDSDWEWRWTANWGIQIIELHSTRQTDACLSSATCKYPKAIVNAFGSTNHNCVSRYFLFQGLTIHEVVFIYEDICIDEHYTALLFGMENYDLIYVYHLPAAGWSDPGFRATNIRKRSFIVILNKQNCQLNFFYFSFVINWVSYFSGI